MSDTGAIKVDTEEQALHEAATAATGGLTDFGPDGYREGLRLLLDAIERDIALAADYRERIMGLLIGPLIGRLWSQKGWTKHPDCLEQALPAPLIITGIPRTGTTALHNLLSMDGQFQGLQQWLISTPMPRPPRAQWSSQPQFRQAVTAQNALFDAVPGLRESHAVQPEEVDECLLLIAQDFISNYFGSALPVASYDAWFLEQDERLAFRRFADNLRLIGSSDPGKRWLLKNPSHVLSIEAVLATFPDAVIVQTHRDPVQAIPSACSVISGFRQFLTGPAYDPAQLGRRETKLWKIAMERAMAAREEHGEHFFDVDFRRFNLEPMAVVEDIYDFAGLALPDTAQVAMLEWIARDARGRGAVHRYTPEQFGLSEAGLRRDFETYRRRFALDGDTPRGGHP